MNITHGNKERKTHIVTIICHHLTSRRRIKLPEDGIHYTHKVGDLSARTFLQKEQMQTTQADTQRHTRTSTCVGRKYWLIT